MRTTDCQGEGPGATDTDGRVVTAGFNTRDTWEDVVGRDLWPPPGPAGTYGFILET